jgi:hypothetical protein
VRTEARLDVGFCFLIYICTLVHVRASRSIQARPRADCSTPRVCFPVLPHLSSRADSVPHSGQTTCGLQHALCLLEWFVCSVTLPHLHPRADPSYSPLTFNITYTTPRAYLAPHFGPSTCGLLHTLHVLFPLAHVFYISLSHFSAVAYLSLAHVAHVHTFTFPRAALEIFYPSSIGTILFVWGGRVGILYFYLYLRNYYYYFV